ncbi:acyl-CoA N-acyltransferase [Suillus subluteus]|nr:acyl-CoA N-acyltransferase [Suillus subluteus]
MPMTHADLASLDLMFPQELISPKVLAQLPSGVSKTQMRPLVSTDYKRRHLDVLSVISIVNDLGEVLAWVSQFRAMRATPNAYFSVVILDKASDEIVGVGTVFIEHKFLRGFGGVGHIEDIAVDQSQQGMKLGLRIIQALTHISESSGCYKIILNCNDTNIPFYRKCGNVKEKEMMSL